MPFGGLLAASIAAPMLGGVIGNIAGSGDRDQQQQLQQQALQSIMGVGMPDINQMKLALQQYQLAGKLTPEMEGTISQGESGMNKISTDPRLMQAQMGALAKLQQLGGGGLQPEDQAALAKIMNQNASAAHAADQSILQNMQQRGIATQGSELAQRLASAQGAAQNASQQGLDLAGQASQRALQAIMQGGTLGGQIQGQQFGQKAQIAAAQDAINKFNSANAQNIMGTNVQNQNAAQAANLQAQQNLMNQNTGQANQQQMYNKNLLQQDYENRLRKAQGIYGAQENAANQAGQRAAQAGQMWSGIGSGVGGGLAQAGMYSKLFPAKAAAGAIPPATQNNGYYPQQDESNWGK